MEDILSPFLQFLGTVFTFFALPFFFDLDTLLRLSVLGPGSSSAKVDSVKSICESRWDIINF
jgi:hypothetical protein